MITNSLCTIRKHLKIIPAGKDQYHELAKFHYRGDTLGPHSHIFAIVDEHPWRRLAAPVIGVIVYRPPVPNLAARNIATGGLFSGLDRSTGLTLLNNSLKTVSRVIIEPRCRGLGLASWLVKETMPLVGTGMVEAVAVMGKVHPFFKQAGMTEFTPKSDLKTERMTAALETAGIGQNIWPDTERVHHRIDTLDPYLRLFMESEIRAFLQKFGSRRDMPHSVERTEFVLSKLAPPGNYYLWINPKKTAGPKLQKDRQPSSLFVNISDIQEATAC